MSISQIDYSLIRAIIKENIEDFIASIKSGASLNSVYDKPRRSSNKQIQTMIGFVNALAKDHIPTDITVTLLEFNLSSYHYTLLSGYEQKELEEFIVKRKEKLKKQKPYKPTPV